MHRQWTMSPVSCSSLVDPKLHFKVYKKDPSCRYRARLGGGDALQTEVSKLALWYNPNDPLWNAKSGMWIGQFFNFFPNWSQIGWNLKIFFLIRYFGKLINVYGSRSTFKFHVAHSYLTIEYLITLLWCIILQVEVTHRNVWNHHLDLHSHMPYVPPLAPPCPHGAQLYYKK